ncbi:conserved hypothetical protein [gamma proteobacterium NOR5-3]|nr:conserved hypothetical protein [gamma proteobacterium NOR5-3]
MSNRHGVLESYQYQRVQQSLDQKNWSSTILAAVASADDVPAFDESTVREVLSKESVAAGRELDAVLERNMPPRYVSDPEFEWTGSGEEAAIVVTVASDRGEQAITTLDSIVAKQMLRFSRFAQAWINDARAVWSTQAAAGEATP